MTGNKCPLCGTHGKLWNRKPEAFVCPSCSSIFSPFGLVMESRREIPDLWS